MVSLRSVLAYLMILSCCLSSVAQSDKELKFIFVPHPRSENRTVQSVLPAIEKIDFSLYDMTLLGGDITYYTSINRTSMDYCDRLFDLKSPNTLWTMGNHDLNSRSLVQEYTGRPPFFTYFRDGITFFVLDTEQNASGLTKSIISGNQLELLKVVTDTISKSDFLIVLHGRLLWMIGNPELKSKLDSVAESTKQLVTTNFYPDVFPLLQNAKANGVRVMCLGGDKSKINIDYSPEDSIRFFGSTMAPEFTDDQNDVMVFTYDKTGKKMSWKFVSLTNIEKKQTNAIEFINSGSYPILKAWPSTGKQQINIQLLATNSGKANIQVFSLEGKLCLSFLLNTNEIRQIDLEIPGMYLLKAELGGKQIDTKIVVN